MATPTYELSNFNQDGTCSLCEGAAATFDVVTASDLLLGAPLCGRCLFNLARAGQRNQPSGRSKRGRPNRTAADSESPAPNGESEQLVPLAARASDSAPTT